MATELLHPISTDLRLARELANLADEVSMATFAERDFGVYLKEDRTHVTDADRAVERVIRERLEQARPGDSLFGEEYGVEGSSKRQWIIDPIDGTANFMRGVPIWATLIALAVDGEPVLGVVSAPALQRRWWGARGLGAYADLNLGGAQPNERRLQVSGIGDLDQAQLSYGSTKYWQDEHREAAILELNRRVWRSRSIGEFWPYMLVAEGSFEIATELGLQPYDMAALIPIIEEAGGTFTGVNGAPGPWEGSALATNGVLHDAALAILRG